MPVPRQPKRLVFCFDGTSNTLDIPYPTNVAITAAAVQNTSRTGPQIVYYDEGVGSGGAWDKITGGAVGAGLYDRVVEAYKFLVFNHEPGDEIFIFGFSRGAYTARSFAGLIRHAGVVNSCFADKIKVATALYQNREKKDVIDDRDEINQFRREFVIDSCASDQDVAWRTANIPGCDPTAVPMVRVRYIGVWDTVKTIGDPRLGDRDNDGEFDDAEFHDHNLYSSVVSARHAVSIDERRKKFDVTLWNNIDELNRSKNFAVDDPTRPYQQQWFPGGHGSVGGGGDIRGLSDEGLEWILEGAKRQGLKLDTTTHSKIWGIKPDVLVSLSNSSTKSWAPADVIMRHLSKKDRSGPKFIHEVSTAAIVRWAAPNAMTPGDELYRPAPLAVLTAKVNAAAAAYEPWEFETRGGFVTDGVAVAPTVTSGAHTFRRYVIKLGESL